jgi:putative transcriptional regulator
LKISQQELADRIGVSRQTINAIELEKYVPSATVIMKIAHIFGKKVEDIFTLEESDWK